MCFNVSLRFRVYRILMESLFLLLFFFIAYSCLFSAKSDWSLVLTKGLVLLCLIRFVTVISSFFQFYFCFYFYIKIHHPLLLFWLEVEMEDEKVDEETSWKGWWEYFWLRERIWCESIKSGKKGEVGIWEGEIWWWDWHGCRGEKKKLSKWNIIGNLQ